MLYDPTEHLPAKIPDEVIERIRLIDEPKGKVNSEK